MTKNLSTLLFLLLIAILPTSCTPHQDFDAEQWKKATGESLLGDKIAPASSTFSANQISMSSTNSTTSCASNSPPMSTRTM